MLEVADIFRAHGPSWRHEQRGHLSVGQLKVHWHAIAVDSIVAVITACGIPTAQIPIA